jgi:hypothetical protein
LDFLFLLSNKLTSLKIALIAFPPLRVGQASVQNSARATFLQGGQFIQQEKKEIPKNSLRFQCHKYTFLLLLCNLSPQIDFLFLHACDVAAGPQKSGIHVLLFALVHQRFAM